MLSRSFAAFCFSVCSLPILAQATPVNRYERVIGAGTPTPMVSQAFSRFGLLGELLIGADGSLVFGANVTSAPNDFAVLMGRNTEDLQVWILEGTTPPGTGVGPVGRRANGIAIRGGRVAADMSLAAGGNAVFEGVPGNLSVVVREGDRAPGGALIRTIFRPFYDPTGRVIFDVRLQGGDVVPGVNEAALMVGPRSNLQFVARGGDPVNGGQQVATAFSEGVYREDGNLVCVLQLSEALGTAPATAADNQAVGILDVTGNLTTVLRKGDVIAPGVRADGIFRIEDVHPDGSFVACGLSSTGPSQRLCVVFDANAGSQKALWPGVPLQGLGQLVMAQVGATGIGDRSIILSAVLAGPGVTAGNDGVVLAIDRVTGDARVLLREGDPAPGFASGATIEAVFNMNTNHRGQFLLRTRVRGRSVLYGFDPSAGFVPVTDPAGAFPIEEFDLNDTGDVVFATSQGVYRTHLGTFFGVPSAIDATAGGVHTMEIDADSSLAGLPYFIAGSTSGTSPGTPVTPRVRIPLNLDAWTSTSFGAVNTQLFSANLGVLDGNGFAQSQLTVPAGVSQFAGTIFHHAYAVIGPGRTIEHVSEPVFLRLF